MSDSKHDPNATLPDHDYDGICEEDNRLPKWWSGLFLIVILFSIVYTPVVHMLDILPQHELEQAVAKAAQMQQQREIALEASGVLDKDPVAAGQKYFKTFCVNCHGSNAEGGLCPNLTDSFWIHTPRMDSIRSVIMNGVPSKGMPTWGPIIGERKIKSIATYVGTLWKTPPPVSGKKAEGTEYDMGKIRAEEASTLAVASDTSAAKKQ